MNDDIFTVGQTVYHKYTGKAHVIRRISAGNQLAFGNPPYTSGSYLPPYLYRADRIVAQTEALTAARRNLPHEVAAVVKAQDDLVKAKEHIAWLEEQLATVVTA